MFEQRRTVQLRQDFSQLSSLTVSANDNSRQREKYRKFLSAAIKSLPPRQRDSIRLYYLEGKKQQEIAELLGVERSTVSRRLKAARESLQKLAALFTDAGIF